MKVYLVEAYCDSEGFDIIHVASSMESALEIRRTAEENEFYEFVSINEMEVDKKYAF